MNTNGLDMIWMPVLVMMAMAIVTWLISLKLRDVSIVDSLWSLLFIAFSVTYAMSAGVSSVVSYVLLALLLLWGLRLSIYITWRNHGHGEDRRYQAIRARNQPGFEFKSLYLVFLLQAVLAAIIVLPVVPVLNERQPANVLTWVGAAVALFGVIYETVADVQMARFKADSQSHGQVMNRGLWRYSRHPNYFAEAVFWWGLWLVSTSMGGAWTVFSPMLITFLLLRVSGVPLLEADLKVRRPAYAEYLRTTSSFFPRPPKH